MVEEGFVVEGEGGEGGEGGEVDAEEVPLAEERIKGHLKLL